MRHAPLYKTLLQTWVVFAGTISYFFLTGNTSPYPTTDAFWPWFVLGMTYTNLIEYCWHNFAMHHRLPGLAAIWISHRHHHAIFNGNNFQTDRKPDMAYIVPNWPLFPALFLVHFILWMAFFPRFPVPAFFLGAAVHYSIYEISHWCTHVHGTLADRILARIPVLSSIRSFQIEWHRRHHEVPADWFNFTPPYSGDIIARLWRRVTSQKTPRT